MAKKFNYLRAEMSPERQKRNTLEAAALIEEYDRHAATASEFREKLGLTRARLSAIMGLDETRLAHLENETDMLLRAVRDMVEVTGAELNFIVRLNGEKLHLERFSDVYMIKENGEAGVGSTSSSI